MTASPTEFGINPRHGIHDPQLGTPARVPGSIRRTSTIDSFRPDGPDGQVIVTALARDLVTVSADKAIVLGTAELRVEIDWPAGYTITRIESDVEGSRVAQLVGRRASSGFRSAVQEVLPDHHRGKTLLNLLLDDLPGAALVSGYAVQRQANGAPRRPAGPVLQIENLCAGFRAGGTIMRGIAGGAVPVVTGPPAAPIDGDDELAWHTTAPLPVTAMRRRRRIDVVVADPLDVRGWLRDSHQGADVETVVHEYDYRATVDPETLAVLDADAEARVLPWLECNPAARSAKDIIGMSVDTLRQDVRTQLTGVRSCTHLNDCLRGLEDVGELAALAVR